MQILQSAIAQNESKSHLKGLVGSSLSFVISNAFKQSDKPFLIVFNDNWEVIGVDDNPDAPDEVNNSDPRATMQMGGNVYPVNYVPKAQPGTEIADYAPNSGSNFLTSIINIQN